MLPPLKFDDFPIEPTYGALFFGLLAAGMLYGGVVFQTFLYIRRYPYDPRRLRCLVMTIFLLDSTQLVLCFISMYWYLLKNYAQPFPGLVKPSWAMHLQATANGLTSLLVQCFFARRLWIFSGNLVVGFVIVLFSFVYFALSLYTTVMSFKPVELINNSTWVVPTGLAAAAIADILIAGGMSHYLARNLSAHAGSMRSNSMISTLNLYALATGSLTGVIAVVCLVSFLAYPSGFVWLAFMWTISQCYANCMLASLNIRETLREKARRPDAGVSTLFQLTRFRNVLEDLGERDTDSQSGSGPVASEGEKPSDAAGNT